MDRDVPSFPDDRAREAVHDCLAEAGYTQEALHQALGVPDHASPRSSLGPAVLSRRVGELSEPTRTLLRLFLEGRDVETKAVRGAVGPDVTDAMEASGLVRAVDDAWRATVLIAPLGALAVASDRAERHRARADDFVIGVGGVTRRLAHFTMRAPVDSALDLGCGAGALGGLMAGHARRVVATDVNPRAVAFARFNAELNGLAHMDCREGSLYEPVAGERFDLITCNPPYVISPTRTFVYRDGGTHICRAVMRDAREHLTDAGCLEMMAEWPQRADQDWRAEVLSWLDGVPCDAWLLRLYSEDPEMYAWRWIMQDEEAPEQQVSSLDTWVRYLGGEGIESVGGGLMVLRPATGRSPVRELRDAPPVGRGSVGPSLSRWLEAQTFLAGLGDDEELVDAHLLPSPELVRGETTRVTEEGGWAQPTVRLRLDGGLGFAARVDQVGAHLVGLLRPDRTPREALGVFAERHGVPADVFLRGLPALLRRLLSLGVLLPTHSAPH